jgi:hypothetical protein
VLLSSAQTTSKTFLLRPDAWVKLLESAICTQRFNYAAAADRRAMVAATRRIGPLERIVSRHTPAP